LQHSRFMGQAIAGRAVHSTEPEAERHDCGREVRHESRLLASLVAGGGPGCGRSRKVAAEHNNRHGARARKPQRHCGGLGTCASGPGIVHQHDPCPWQPRGVVAIRVEVTRLVHSAGSRRQLGPGHGQAGSEKRPQRVRPAAAAAARHHGQVGRHRHSRASPDARPVIAQEDNEHGAQYGRRSARAGLVRLVQPEIPRMRAALPRVGHWHDEISQASRSALRMQVALEAAGIAEAGRAPAGRAQPRPGRLRCAQPGRLVAHPAAQPLPRWLRVPRVTVHERDATLGRRRSASG
jgi:hypothetical protein